jgi:hypothetical protein
VIDLLVRVQTKLAFGQLLRLGEVLYELRKYMSDHLAPPTASLFVYLRKSGDGVEVIKHIALAMHMLSRCVNAGGEMEANVRFIVAPDLLA